MNKRNFKGWLYLLPAMLFLGIFMVWKSFFRAFTELKATEIRSASKVERGTVITTRIKVFMILFKKTAYSDGLINLVLKLFGQGPVDFIDGPYWAKMLVLCIYTIWIVMPFKVLILTSALASVN